MRDRTEIEVEIFKASDDLGLVAKSTRDQLMLELLLDIRDQLVNISSKQSHIIEGVGLLRDIRKDITASGRARLRASR